MKELEVRIVKLEPMRVASFYGFGTSPENEAREKLIAWAKPKGLLDNPDEHRIFGFDNPHPSHGSPNYGYEFWITVGTDIAPEGEVRIEEFLGGLYAVTRCRGVKTITDTWNRLYKWIIDSKYSIAYHQMLEAHIGKFPTPDDELTLDLHAAISE